MSYNSMLNHFRKCDALREKTRTLEEEQRYQYLLSLARTTGVGGKDRLEFSKLGMKKAYL